jgi:hypothetical protein
LESRLSTTSDGIPKRIDGCEEKAVSLSGEKRTHMNFKNIIRNSKEAYYFHDDFYSDKEIVIPDFPFKDIFGDFRLFNGLPLEVVDEFVGRLRELMIELSQAHAKYKNYWKTRKTEW